MKIVIWWLRLLFNPSMHLLIKTISTGRMCSCGIARITELGRLRDNATSMQLWTASWTFKKFEKSSVHLISQKKKKTYKTLLQIEPSHKNHKHCNHHHHLNRASNPFNSFAFLRRPVSPFPVSSSAFLVPCLHKTSSSAPAVLASADSWKDGMN